MRLLLPVLVTSLSLIAWRLETASCTWRQMSISRPCLTCMQESTKSVILRNSESRQSQNGALIFAYEYFISTTRGDRRIFSSVGLSNQKLYIVNGRVACPAESCDTDTAVVQQMRKSVESFDVSTDWALWLNMGSTESSVRVSTSFIDSSRDASQDLLPSVLLRHRS